MANKEYDVAAISKAVKIIDYIKEKKAAYFINIQTDLGFAKSTTYQLLSTFEKYNIVSKTDDGKYELGIKLFEWGYAMFEKIDIRKVSYNILSELSERVGLSVHLGIMSRADQATFIEKIDGPLYTIKTTVLGQKILFHCNSTGKALLAWQDEETQNRIIRNIEYTQFTPNTITNEADLRRDLALTRKRGYALDRMERDTGVIGIGVPVFNWSGNVVAAISFGILNFEIDEKDYELYAGYLIEGSKKITARLGA